MRKPKSLFLLADYAHKLVYGADVAEALDDLCDFYAPPQTAESIALNPEVLEQAEVIFSGWHAPRLDEDLLRYATNLKIVFYGGGSIRSLVDEAFWLRGIRITNAVHANAIPVAQYSVSQIVFALKLGWQHNQRCKEYGEGSFLEVPGACGSTVGLISLGNIARLVRSMLPEELNVIAYDPYVDPKVAAGLNVNLVSLSSVFERSHVISLHAPLLPETQGMIGREHFSHMQRYATFINTARSGLVRHEELIEVYRKRPDLWAVLDLFEQLPDAVKDELRTMPNVTLTPHIAGSIGSECLRMGRYMVDECRRYLANEPLLYEVDQRGFMIMA